MIRDKRTWISVNAVGAAAALFLLVSSSAFPHRHSVLPQWFLQADAALLLALFIYAIVLRLRGPIEPMPWARNMSDRQLWIVKGLLGAVVIGVTLVVVLHRGGR